MPTKSKLDNCQVLFDSIVVAKNPLDDQEVGSSSNMTFVYASLKTEITSSGCLACGVGADSVGARISVTSKFSST